MRVAKSRWGEVTIKKQGSKKNKFDATKSFSVTFAKNEYSIEEYLEILKMITDLTDKFTSTELIKKLEILGD